MKKIKQKNKLKKINKNNRIKQFIKVQMCNKLMIKIKK